VRVNLTKQRRTRLLKISSPGEWVSLVELVSRYNQQYETSVVTKTLPKLAMHEARLKRVLDNLVAEGCYEYDKDRGYRFLTSHPRK
jgi:hypothetical protein